MSKDESAVKDDQAGSCGVTPPQGDGRTDPADHFRDAEEKA